MGFWNRTRVPLNTEGLLDADEQGATEPAQKHVSVPEAKYEIGDRLYDNNAVLSGRFDKLGTVRRTFFQNGMEIWYELELDNRDKPHVVHEDDLLPLNETPTKFEKGDYVESTEGGIYYVRFPLSPWMQERTYSVLYVSWKGEWLSKRVSEEEIRAFDYKSDSSNIRDESTGLAILPKGFSVEVHNTGITDTDCDGPRGTYAISLDFGSERVMTFEDITCLNVNGDMLYYVHPESVTLTPELIYMYSLILRGYAAAYVKNLETTLGEHSLVKKYPPGKLGE